MEYCSDLDFRITRLFFAKTSLLKVLKLNYEVLLIDCTYKTNFYQMPLCIITGITPMNTTYYVGFAFLATERVEDYRWILQCVRRLYEALDIPDPSVIITDADPAIIRAFSKECLLSSHLLCLWHLNKNVVVNCKKLFEDEKSWEEFYGSWYQVLYANKEGEFEENWEEMKIRYAEHLRWPIDYLEDGIIMPHRFKVVKCYTNQLMHFGNTSTSRAEGQHAKLKAALVSSLGWYL